VSMQPVGKNILFYKFLTLKVPVVKGLSAASAAVVKMIFLSHTMPRYLNVSV
jgi:hypothetical protein